MEAKSSHALAADQLAGAPTVFRKPTHIPRSVRFAVASGAVITGTYCLVVGSMLSWRPWILNKVGPLTQVSGGFAFVTAIMDIAIIFSVLVKNDRILKYSICATMAVHMVTLPLIIFTFLGAMMEEKCDIALWEMLRFFISLVHLALMYCLLVELRGVPVASTPPPPPEEGWLKNNLALKGPTLPAGDKALLKLQVELPNARPGGANGGTAVFAPSSCTTAAPVHPLYPPTPAPDPARAPATTHASVAAPTASSPASTSEA